MVGKLGPPPRVGQRIVFTRDGEKGTIRFIGKIHSDSDPQIENQTWAGVEWDTPTRGNHDGQVDGKRYFTCSKGGSGSFLRCITSRARNVIPDENDEDKDHGPVAIKGAIIGQGLAETFHEYYCDEGLEASGIDIMCPRSIENITECTLRDKAIAWLHDDESPDLFSRVRIHLARLTTLDLANNLLTGLDVAFDIFRVCPNLHRLNLSSNLLGSASSLEPFQAPTKTEGTLSSSVLPLARSKLKVLSLNGTKLLPTELATLLRCCPVLEELQFCTSELNDRGLRSILDEFPPSLRTLLLNDGKLTCLGALGALARRLDRVETLVLSDNPLSCCCPCCRHLCHCSGRDGRESSSSHTVLSSMAACSGGCGHDCFPSSSAISDDGEDRTSETAMTILPVWGSVLKLYVSNCGGLQDLASMDTVACIFPNLREIKLTGTPLMMKNEAQDDGTRGKVHHQDHLCSPKGSGPIVNAFSCPSSSLSSHTVSPLVDPRLAGLSIDVADPPMYPSPLSPLSLLSPPLQQLQQQQQQQQQEASWSPTSFASHRHQSLLVAAHLPKVHRVNGIDITTEDREEGERACLRFWHRSLFKPRRYPDLVAVHGVLAPLVEVDFGGGHGRRDPTGKIRIEIDMTALGTPKRLGMRISPRMTVRHLHEQLAKKCGVPPHELTLYYSDQSPGPEDCPDHSSRVSGCVYADHFGIEELKLPSLSLSRYDIQEGDIIIVEPR